MTVILDTGVLLAIYDRDDDRHEDAAAWYTGLADGLVTTPVVLAEMDHLVAQRLGATAQRGLWRDLDRDAYAVRWWADALRETIAIARRQPFLGLADASLVALARLLRTDRIATFDEHFRSVTTQNGEGFVLLPDDA